MIAGDLLDDLGAIIGVCSDDAKFALLTDATEQLANETWQDAAGNMRSWDALESYLLLPVQSSNLVVLPADVETPVRLNISDAPTLFRSRLFEFQPNGPGSVTGDRQVASWEDHGFSPTSLLMDGLTQVRFKTTDANSLHITGYTVGNIRVENYVVPTAYDGQYFTRIESIARPLPGSGPPTIDQVITLLGTPLSGSEATYAVYGPKDLDPQYRVIRLSTTGATVRMLYRRKTFKITSAQDYIPLNSRLAVLYMAKAIRRGLIEDYNPQAELLQGKAVELLKKEQMSRSIAQTLATTQQIDRTMGRNPNAGELVTAFDLYDDACDTCGPVGMDRIFEWLTEAVRILARKANWDSLLTYLLVPIAGDTISLPPEADSYLRISVDAKPVRFFSRLYEFTLNGPGEDEVYSEATAEERGDSPTFVVPDPATPFYLNKNAGPRTITVCGWQGDQIEVLNYDVPVSPATGILWTRITSVQVSKGTASVNLYANGVGISVYNPNDTTPIYRRIKLRKGGATARVLIRKKTAQITALTDIIPLRSRQAVTLMMKSMKAGMAGDADGANAFETLALRYLEDEQKVRSTPDSLAESEQIDGALNLNLRARDVLVVGDVYDECVKITGQVGRQTVFDILSQASDLLENAADGAWDSQQGFADITSQDDFVFALPREIGDVLQINVCGRPASHRNRWTEYSLDGPGQFDPCCDRAC